MIQIYSTPHCHWCKRAKAYFAEEDIPYIDHDVSTDEVKAREMIEKSGQMGVPVIIVGASVIIGFDKDAIQAARKTL